MNRLMPVVTQLTTERLFLLVLFASAFIGISGYDSDTYLHLSTGRYILESNTLPHVDVFSFTRHGMKWVMHEWLYQIFIYSLYSAWGTIGLKFFGAGTLIFILYLNKRNCEITGASNFLSWVFTLVTLLTWINFISVRPHIITFLFFVITYRAILLYRNQAKTTPLYLLPLVIPIWVNCHGGFIVGIVLLGYCAAIALIERYITRSSRQSVRPLLIAFAACTAASLLNPYGFEQLLFPFQLMNQWVIDYTIEWMAPDFAQWDNAIYLVIVSLFALTLHKTSRYERAYRIAVALPFLVASFEAIRHIPLATFVVAPFVASQITRLRADRISGSHPESHAVTNNLMKTHANKLNAELGVLEYILNWCVLLVFCITLTLAYPTIHWMAEKSFRKKFPVGATQYLTDHNIQGRMFTTLQYSDYILFTRYPAQQLFYDVRLEIYGEELAKEYLTILNAWSGWHELLRKYAIDYAVLDKSKPIYRAISNTTDYRLLYEDSHSAVFYRQDANSDPGK